MDYRNILDQVLLENGNISQEEYAQRARNSHVFDFPALYNMLDNYNKYRTLGLNDKYKHAMINCKAAQSGIGGALFSDILSRLKEKKDVILKSNTQQESNEDMQANLVGRYLGIKYPKGNCDELVQKYYKKQFK